MYGGMEGGVCVWIGGVGDIWVDLGGLGVGLGGGVDF